MDNWFDMAYVLQLIFIVVFKPYQSSSNISFACVT